MIWPKRSLSAALDFNPDYVNYLTHSVYTESLTLSIRSELHNVSSCLSHPNTFRWTELLNRSERARPSQHLWLRFPLEIVLYKCTSSKSQFLWSLLWSIISCGSCGENKVSDGFRWCKPRKGLLAVSVNGKFNSLNITNSEFKGILTFFF